MEESKTFFEQIPVETVKRIANEFPEEHAIGSDSENTQTHNRPDKDRQEQDEVSSPHERWRELAQSVQQEQDSARMSGLVEQLIAALDQEQLYKRLTLTRHAGIPQAATEQNNPRTIRKVDGPE